MRKKTYSDLFGNPVSDERMKALMTDWYDRDQEDYINIRKTGRLGWEKTLEPGQAFASKIADTSDDETIIKEAYRTAEEFLRSMNLPDKFTLRIEEGAGGMTDGTNIYVRTSMFDDPNLSPGDKLDAFIGLTIHEACHVKYTDMVASASHTPGIHMITNILEDQRIEEKCAKEMPGLANFLVKTKDYIFGQSWQKHLDKEKKACRMPLFSRFINTLIGKVRYPRCVSEEDLATLAPYLEKAKEKIVPLPDSTAGCAKAAAEIMKIIKELYDENNSKDRNDATSTPDDADTHHENNSKDRNDATNTPDDADTHDENNSKDRNDATNTPDDADTSKGKTKAPQNQGGTRNEHPKPQNKSCEGNKKETDVGNENDDATKQTAKDPETHKKQNINTKAKEETSQMMREDAEKTEDELRQFCPDPNNRLDQADMASVVKKNIKRIENECLGKIEKGTKKDTFFIKQEPNKTKYEESYKKIRRYIPAIAKSLKCRSEEQAYSEKSMRSGTLDTNKLAEAHQGVPSVYVRKGTIKSDKIAVCILVDESGSMAYYHNGITRSDAARDTAILINEAIGHLPNVELFIYGHSTEMLSKLNETDIFVYRDNKHAPKYGLGSIDVHRNNIDGMAIREVAQRVRKQTDRKVLMFVISDGLPCGHNYTGDKAIQDTREAVREVTKMNFDIVQICIGNCEHPEKMFDHYVKNYNLSKLAPDLGRMIKKAISDGTKKRRTIA